jgi:hypothetical protein
LGRRAFEVRLQIAPEPARHGERWREKSSYSRHESESTMSACRSPSDAFAPSIATSLGIG